MANIRLHRCDLRKSLLRATLVVNLLLACVGCWEEIRYDPGKVDPGKVDPGKVDPGKVQPLQQPAIQEAAAATVETEEAKPTVGQLFPEGPPTSSLGEPEQSTVEEQIARPDEPLTDVLKLDEERPATTTSPAPPAELDWLDDLPVVETAGDAEPMAPSRTAVAAWQMSSKWSLAAAYYAKGLGANRYGEPFEQANHAARLLEVQLPALPEKPDGASLQPVVVRYLLEESGPQLADQLGDRFPADHAVLVKLAVKTHALLLIYTPRNKDLDLLIPAIRRAAENSGLPENVWQELVDLLERREEFARIKQAVFQLHDRATAHLAGSASE